MVRGAPLRCSSRKNEPPACEHMDGMYILFSFVSYNPSTHQHRAHDIGENHYHLRLASQDT